MSRPYGNEKSFIDYLLAALYAGTVSSVLTLFMIGVVFVLHKVSPLLAVVAIVMFLVGAAIGVYAVYEEYITVSS